MPTIAQTQFTATVTVEKVSACTSPASHERKLRVAEHFTRPTIKCLKIWNTPKGRGEAAGLQVPQIEIKKKRDFVDKMILSFCMMYPSGEISH